jgi:DNA-binding MarR family transcriptional regulator
MKTSISKEQTLALTLAAASSQLEKRLDSSLGAIRGISLAEYRLLRALADAPSSWASRVDLAQTIGMTPSGVTRALRPLEKLGLITTAKSKRDARLALTSLTPAGHELVDDASAVVNDTMQTLLERTPGVTGQMDQLLVMLEDLSR